MKVSRRYNFITKFIAVACAFATGSCDWFTSRGPTLVTGTTYVAPRQRVPECDHDFAITTRMDSDTVTITSVPLIDPIRDIPEFHDCQKFAGVGSQYGPLVAIYASASLNNLTTDLGPYQGGNPAGMVAVPVAIIFNFGPGVYNALNIRTSFSCLYFARTSRPDEPGDGLTAYMITDVADPRTRCSRRTTVAELLAEPGGARRLAVAPKRYSGDFGFDDYPPVARWDWDGTLQYIGIKCEAAWCDVGRGVNASPDHTPQAPFNASVKGRRVHKVKGWYDEQQLALVNSSGTIFNSQARGTIVPDPGLRDRTSKSDFDADWVIAARVYLAQPMPVYKGKFNFRQGVVGTPVASEIYLRRFDGSDSRWAAKIVTPDTTVYRQIIYRPHSHPVDNLGTVRWRWKNDDETTWIGCPEGCCEMQRTEFLF